MKTIKNGIRYDTETATVVAEWDNGLVPGDLDYVAESLYRTEASNWFVYGRGGARTQYGESNGRDSWGASKIIPLTEDEAMKWCEEHDQTRAIEQHFTLRIKDA